MAVVLARYLMSSRDYKTGNGGGVKGRAFDPGDRDEVSVFNTSGLTPEQVVETGKEVLKYHPPTRRYHGRAEITESQVVEVGLLFRQDDTPLPGHGNILGWPPGKTPEVRSEKLLLAKQLASRAELVLLEEPYQAA